MELRLGSFRVREERNQALGWNPWWMSDQDLRESGAGWLGSVTTRSRPGPTTSLKATIMYGSVTSLAWTAETWSMVLLPSSWRRKYCLGVASRGASREVGSGVG